MFAHTALPCLCLILPILLPTTPVTPSQTDADAASQLRNVEAHRGLIAREIAQVENRADAEARKILDQLDEFFRSESIHSRFEAHYLEVEKTLAKVGLPADVRNLNLTWVQLKAGLGAGQELTEICEGFVNEASRQIEPLAESLMKGIAGDLERTQTTAIIAAQNMIWAPFEGILSRNLPAWEGVHLPPPPLPPDLLPDTIRTDGLDAGEAATMVAALILILAKKLVRRVIQRVFRKIIGRVLAKLIPFLGWALLALDFWDAAHARAQLEVELRSQFLAEYRAEFSADAVWREAVDDNQMAFRDILSRDVTALLHSWAEHCRVEAVRVVDAAQVLTISPQIRDYLEAQAERGRNTREVVEELAMVWDVFHELVARAPIEQLLDMIVQTPDRRELSRLADELGDRLLIEHRRHGRALLSAAHIMGVPTFLALSRSGGKLDWRDAVTAFETLPRDATQATRDGLLLVVECGLDHRGIPTSALERISRVGDGFRSLVSIVPDRRRLLNLFGDDRLIELVTIGMAKDQPFTEAAARIWPTQVWQRYSRDGKRFDALYSIASYRRDEFGQPPDALAEEVAGQDELTPVYLDVGIEGVRLWDAHVTPGSGEHQRQLANRAIGLFKKGYPPNDLQTTEGVRLAEIFDWLPGGLSLYHVLAPLGRWAFVLLGGFVLVVLMMTVFVARRLISRMAPSIRRAAK